MCTPTDGEATQTSSTSKSLQDEHPAWGLLGKEDDNRGHTLSLVHAWHGEAWCYMKGVSLASYFPVPAALGIERICYSDGTVCSDFECLNSECLSDISVGLMNRTQGSSHHPPSWEISEMIFPLLKG